MNREELVKEIAKSTKLSQKSVSEVLSATVESIQNTVKKGDKVTLVGFGTFESRRRAARNGRNPQTGKEIKIECKIILVNSLYKEGENNLKSEYYESACEKFEEALNIINSNWKVKNKFFYSDNLIRYLVNA